MWIGGWSNSVWSLILKFRMHIFSVLYTVLETNYLLAMYSVERSDTFVNIKRVCVSVRMCAYILECVLMFMHVCIFMCVCVRARAGVCVCVCTSFVGVVCLL